MWKCGGLGLDKLLSPGERFGVLIGGVEVADVEFMFNDPIGGSSGTPLVGEGKVGMEEEIGRKGVVLWLDGQGKCAVCCK